MIINYQRKILEKYFNLITWISVPPLADCKAAPAPATNAAPALFDMAWAAWSAACADADCNKRFYFGLLSKYIPRILLFNRGRINI